MSGILNFKYAREVVTRWAYYTGWTYHATAGSRAAITATLKRGYVMCMDPEAYADYATITLERGDFATDAQLIGPVTKPATGILPLFAGVVVDFAPGYSGSGAGRVLLATAGYGVQAYVKANVTGYDILLAPANDAWELAAVAVGTNGANIPLVVGKPLEIADTSSTAAVKRVNLGAIGHPLAA